MYGIKPDDEDYFKPPKRNRSEIKRSRGDAKRDQHFSEANNDELIKFCRGTGLRHNELADLKGTDLVTREQIEAQITALEQIPEQQRTPGDTKRLQMLQDTRMFEGSISSMCGTEKGGRERVSPIIGKNQTQIIDRMKNTLPEERVWQFIPPMRGYSWLPLRLHGCYHKAHARKDQ